MPGRNARSDRIAGPCNPCVARSQASASRTACNVSPGMQDSLLGESSAETCADSARLSS